MKRLLFLALMASWIGCGEKDPIPAARPVARPPPKSAGTEQLAANPNAEPKPDSGKIGPSTGDGSGALLAGKKIELSDITTALRDYVASRQISPATVKSLDVLVQNKFLPELPPPPPGKKYVWNKFLVVSYADK